VPQGGPFYDGVVVPVKDQGSRTTVGSAFAAVAAIEYEYALQDTVAVDLSEEYLIQMTDENAPLDSATADPGEKLYMAMFYGLPPTSEWPYVPSASVVLSLAREVVPGQVPGAPTDDATLDALLTTDAFDRDLANYSALSFPSVAVHEAAIYGPAPGSIQQILPVGATYPDGTVVDAASFVATLETVLANGDPIAVTTATGTWQQDPSTGIFGYNAAGNATIDHAVLLVGFDQDQQTFRVKNSAGPTWGGCPANAPSCTLVPGYADFSFDLVSNTAGAAFYIGCANGDPCLANSPTGAGAWVGFWTAQMNGVPGVAVIRQAFRMSNGILPGGSSFTEGLSAIGTFYPSDGSASSALPDFTSGDAQTAVLGGGALRLQRAPGALTATASDGATWHKCNPQLSGSFRDFVEPTDYAQAATDSYVLPPCPARAAIAPVPATCSSFASTWATVFQDTTYPDFLGVATAGTGDLFVGVSFWGGGNDVFSLKLPAAQNTVSCSGVQPWVPADVMGMPAEWNSIGTFDGQTAPDGNLYFVGAPGTNTSPLSGWWIRRSTDNGATWTTVDNYTGADVGQAYAGPVGVGFDGSNVFAAGWGSPDTTGTSGIGILRASPDHGATWRTAFSYSYPGISSTYFQRVVLMPSGAIEVFGGAADGSGNTHLLLFQSLDHGTSWSLILDSTVAAGTDNNTGWAYGLPNADGSMILDANIPDNNGDAHWQVWRITPSTSSASVTIVDDFLRAPGQGMYASFAMGMFRDGNGKAYVVGSQMDASGNTIATIRGSADGTTWAPVLDYPGTSNNANFYSMGQDLFGNLYAVGYDGGAGLILALPCLAR
jgi:hypothetical protein